MCDRAKQLCVAGRARAPKQDGKRMPGDAIALKGKFIEVRTVIAF